MDFSDASLIGGNALNGRCKYIIGSTHYLGDAQDFDVSSEGLLSGINS